MASAVLSISGTDILEKKAEGYRCGSQWIARCQNDELLAYAYHRFKEDELLPILFYENHQSMLHFVYQYMQDNVSTLAAWYDDGSGTPKLCGMGWINEFIKMGPDHLRCNSGMGFFRRQKDDPALDLVMYGQMMIEWAFDHLNIDAMHGVTPAKNRAALAFSRKCGFNLSGPIEAGTVWKGELCDVYMSSVTKKRWRSIRPWKEIR